MHRAREADSSACEEIVEILDASQAPTLVVGAGADDEAAWEAVELLAKGLDCPVWQEPFGARAGSRQDADEFAGHLPAGRTALRAALAPHDCVIVIGARSLRQYGYEDGDLFPTSASVAVVTDDVEEATSSTADIALVAPVAATCRELARRVRSRNVTDIGRQAQSVADATLSAGPSSEGSATDLLTAPDVFHVLRRLVPEEAVVLEETPSTRSALQRIVPARRPLGFLSAAMGGLGFAMPAAVGVKLALPDRPVVAVLGDGSSLYTIRALWSAQRYRAGVLFVVLSNGGYAIMDDLAARAGSVPAWPGFNEIRVDDLAAAQGCPAERLTTREEVETRMAALLPGLASAETPLLLNVVVAR